MTTAEMYFWHFKEKLSNVLNEYQRTNCIKQYGFDPYKLVAEYNAAIEDAGRYRWLREAGHLDQFWSVEGPISRGDNIDADIEEAMVEDAVTVLTASHNKGHADNL
jgi:hypothetical protein